MTVRTFLDTDSNMADFFDSAVNGDIMQFDGGSHVQATQVTMEADDVTVQPVPGSGPHTITGTTSGRMEFYGDRIKINSLFLHQTGAGDNAGEISIVGDDCEMNDCDLTNNYGHVDQTHAIKLYIGTSVAPANRFTGRRNRFHEIGRPGYEKIATLVGSHTFPQATITVDSTAQLDSSGSVIIGNQGSTTYTTVNYTGKTGTTLTGCTGGTGTFTSGAKVCDDFNIYAHAYYLSHGSADCEFYDDTFANVLGGYGYHLFGSGNNIKIYLPRWYNSFLFTFSSGSGHVAYDVAGEWDRGNVVFPNPAGGPILIGSAINWPERSPGGRAAGGTGTIERAVSVANAGDSQATGGISTGGSLTRNNCAVIDPQFRNPNAGDFEIMNAAARQHLGLSQIVSRGQINHVVSAPDTGDVNATAMVRITHRATGSLAVLYSSETGSAQLPNPVPTSSANSNIPGRIPGWLEEGSYTLSVSGAGISSYTRAIEINHGAASKVGVGAAGSAAIASDAVTTAKIADGAITAAKLASNAVTTAKITAGAVSTRVFATGTLTSTELADTAIDARVLASNSVAIHQMANNSVGTSELIDGIVDIDLIPPNAISTPHINNLAITAAKIGDAQIDATQIVDGAITFPKLSNPTLPVGHIIFLPYALSDPNWLLCDGSTILRSSPLGIKLGTKYGVGNGTTTCNLPDFRGRIPTGLGTNADVNALGDNDGMSLTSARKPTHGHSMGFMGVESGGTHTHTYQYALFNAAQAWDNGPHGPEGLQIVGYAANALDTNACHSHTLSCHWGINHTLDGPPFIVLNFYIRA